MASALTADLLAHIGRSQTPVMELVTRRDIRKYALATGQSRKRYRQGSEAPPLFHRALFEPLVALDQRKREGRGSDPLLSLLPFEPLGSGTVSTIYYQPIRCGDWIVAQRKLTGLAMAPTANPADYLAETTLMLETDYGAPVLREVVQHPLR